MKSNGASSWQESDAGRQLMERFSEEKTLKALDHLLQRIDTLEKAVENLSTLLQQGPVMASMAADSVDEVYRRASDKGINLEERLANALHLGEQLTAPEMREKIDNLLAFAEQSPALFTMAIDSIDESFRRASSRGVNIDERLRAAAAISEKLTRPEMMERFDKLIDLAGQAPELPLWWWILSMSRIAKPWKVASTSGPSPPMAFLLSSRFPISCRQKSLRRL
jgi:hypothetical protein